MKNKHTNPIRIGTVKTTSAASAAFCAMVLVDGSDVRVSHQESFLIHL
jgi:hypothetical protein